MPKKPDPDVFDDTAALVADNEKLRETVAELESELQKRENDAKRLAEALLALRGTPRPEVFLIIMAVLMAGRMAIYVYVKNAVAGDLEPLVSTAVFGAVATLMFIFWMAAEWKAARWLVIPKTVLLVVVFMIAAGMLSNGMVWAGIFMAPGVDPWPAFELALAALAVAASSLCAWLLNVVLTLLTEPVETVKGIFGR